MEKIVGQKQRAGKHYIQANSGIEVLCGKK